MQLQYVYNSNPEGRRGPDCNITFIYVHLNDSEKSRWPIVYFYCFLAGKFRKCVHEQKHESKDIHIRTLKPTRIAYSIVFMIISKTLYSAPWLTDKMLQHSKCYRIRCLSCLKARLLHNDFELQLTEVAFRFIRSPKLSQSSGWIYDGRDARDPNL